MRDFNGYTGGLLNLDLNNHEIETKNLTLDSITQYIGAFGINCMLLANNLKPKTDPLSPNNVIVIGTGPLVGTLTPGASRTVGTTKFPASNAIASVCGSMSFGMYLKLSGYDNVILSGRSENPIYIEITDEKVEFHDASNLWGRDLIETTDFLWSKYGHCGVIAIGQAGENLVKSSLALIDKTATLGRGGFGAVMGSKRLKAILVKGKKGIKIANPTEFWKLHAKLYDRMRKYPQRKEWQKLGLMKSLPIGMILAAKGEKAKTKQSSERTYLKKLKKRRIACPSCPIGDKDILEIKEGDYSGLVQYTSSVVNAFGLLLLDDISTYNEAVKGFDIINRYGLDALTIIQFLEFCTDLYKKGVLTKENSGLEWKKDYTTLTKLCELIVERKGFGAILAEGWKKLAETFDDVEKDMLVIKGLDQVLEPRWTRLGTMEFEQIVNPKGAHVASGGSPTYFAPGRPLEKFKTHFYRMGIPEPAIQRIYDPPKKEMGLNVGRLTRYAEDWYTVLTNLGICGRAQINRFYSLESVTAFYNAVTGLEASPEDLRKAAERSWNLLKLLNVKEGFSRAADTFPQQWFEPLKFGDMELKFLDFYGGTEITLEIATQLLEDYYDERGWDIKTGIPTEEKFKELGLHEYE